MANEAEEAIYRRLAEAPLFHPSSTDLLADDWALEPGDVVTVKDGETSYNAPVYAMNLEWHGGGNRVEMQSTGNEKREPLPELKRRSYGSSAASYAAVQEQADRLSLMVSGQGDDARTLFASIDMAINGNESQIHISADKIFINGETTISEVFSGDATVSWLKADDIYANNSIYSDYSVGGARGEFNSLYIGENENAATWQDSYVYSSLVGVQNSTRQYVVTSAARTITSLNQLDTTLGYVITGFTRQHIYYLGHS